MGAMVAGVNEMAVYVLSGLGGAITLGALVWWLLPSRRRESPIASVERNRTRPENERSAVPTRASAMGRFKEPLEPVDDSPREEMDLSTGSGFRVSVVGESHYTSAFIAVLGPRTPAGVDETRRAHVRREPSNRFDPNAVVVHLGGRTVGYLSRGDAVRYKAAIETVEREGRVAVCSARVRGGWDRGAGDFGYFGVYLDLPGHARVDDAVARKIPTVIADAALGRIKKLKTRAARQAALQRALGELDEPELRFYLTLEASKIEAHAVLEQVAKLKTIGPKRKRLIAAIQELESDDIADELQEEEIRLLKDALFDLG